jgi:tRNA(Ile)-lysidine synthase
MNLNYFRVIPQDLLQSFQDTIISNRLFEKKHSILLTVSGGIDSVVMLNLFLESGIDIGIAHCNFKLRGGESEEDEAFVHNLASMNNLPFYQKNFDTIEYAESRGISIEMAARELRYAWFEEIRSHYKFDFIATAHNMNDVAETVLLNLSRGTGIRGLTGIKLLSGHVIRPMLFATRSEIESYALRNNLPHREDSTNSSLKFKRNKIRHQILPVLESINPSVIRTIAENAQTLAETEMVFQQRVQEVVDHIGSWIDENYIINLRELEQYTPLRTYLFELVRPFNFTTAQLDGIIESFGSNSGKKFFSSTHRMIKNRDNLIISENIDVLMPRFYIEADTQEIAKPIRLTLKKMSIDESFEFPRSRDIACLDYAQLEFPLLLRRWQKGDYFKPLGMGDFKKLSDFFVDSKLSIPEKENVWLLISGDRIVWVVGKRLDDRFKITQKTKSILLIQLEEKSSITLS